MRALLHDRYGPRRIPLGLAAASCLLGALASLWLRSVDPSSHVATSTLFFAIGALAFASVVPFRFRPREVTLAVRPGHVRVEAGLRSFAIRPRDVRGATTSRYVPGGLEAGTGAGSVDDGTGCVLTLALGTHARFPVSLVLDRKEADLVRGALGLGHGGRGEVSWRTHEPERVRTGRVFGWAAVAACGLAALVSAACALFQPSGEMPDPWLFLLGQVGVIGTLISVVFALVALRGEPTRRVSLRPEAAYVPNALSYAVVPYASLQRVAHGEDYLWLETNGLPPLTVQCSLLPTSELALVASHLEDARRRALGEGARRDEVRERLEMLERRSEPVGAWLARLGGIAATLRTRGYRGGSIEREDLRAAMEDADLDVELRVAAARVLAEVEPEVRTRVAELADTVESDQGARALRVATGEPEALEEALAELDEAAEKKRQVLPGATS